LVGVAAGGGCWPAAAGEKAESKGENAGEDANMAEAAPGDSEGGRRGEGERDDVDQPLMDGCGVSTVGRGIDIRRTSEGTGMGWESARGE
jgi:hypothetical protein